MLKTTLFITLAITTSYANALDLSFQPGKYQIKDWQVRCVDHQPTSTNNFVEFVPLVTFPCKEAESNCEYLSVQFYPSSSLFLKWNISADSPDLFASPNYLVPISTVHPVAFVTYASSGVPGTSLAAFEQQLLLKPNVFEDFEIARWNAMH
jgi:hypothetical protein